MPYPPDSWLVAVWVETGIVGLVLYLLIHGVLFAWCSWLLMFRIMNQRLRGLLAAWLCMNAGFFVAAYANDVMQYPNSIIVYTGFALCIAGPYIDPVMQKEDEELERERKEKKKRLIINEIKKNKGFITDIHETNTSFNIFYHHLLQWAGRHLRVDRIATQHNQFRQL